jgi:hypothetical protein
MFHDDDGKCRLRVLIVPWVVNLSLEYSAAAAAAAATAAIATAMAATPPAPGALQLGATESGEFFTPKSRIEDIAP